MKHTRNLGVPERLMIAKHMNEAASTLKPRNEADQLEPMVEHRLRWASWILVAICLLFGTLIFYIAEWVWSLFK